MWKNKAFLLGCWKLQSNLLHTIENVDVEIFELFVGLSRPIIFVERAHLIKYLMHTSAVYCLGTMAI